MTRRITRNILKVKDIKKLGTQVTQVNDLVNDLENDSYIRREKDYHCLTDNIKTISTGNSSLVDVEITGKNSVKLNPSHDTQKEQVVEAVGELIKITNGKNGTTEKTKIEVLPDKNKANLTDLPSVTSTDKSVTVTKTNNVYDLKVPKVDTSEFALKTELPSVTSTDKSVVVTKTNNEYDLKVSSKFPLKTELPLDIISKYFDFSTTETGYKFTGFLGLGKQFNKNNIKNLKIVVIYKDDTSSNIAFSEDDLHMYFTKNEINVYSYDINFNTIPNSVSPKAIYIINEYSFPNNNFIDFIIPVE